MKYLVLMSLALLPSALWATAAIQNVSSRTLVSLNGHWHAIVDPYDTGYYDYRYVAHDTMEPGRGGFFLDRPPRNKSDLVEYSFDASPTLKVPGDWNSQDPKLHYYEGSVWFRRKFDRPALPAGGRAFVHFGGANYQAEVYLNGRKLGRHVGGFTPFDFEITGLLRERGNSLVVRVDNRRTKEGVPTVNTDWWNYGGITRDVSLVVTPANFIREYSVQLAPGSSDRILVTATIDGEGRAGQPVRVGLPGLPAQLELTTDAEGHARGEMTVAGLELWSPEQPRLHEVVLRAGEDSIAERLGFRTIATRGADILLNGNPVFLRGICLHEENPLRGGRAWSEADARLLLGWAKELRCNFVRLAHYPHNEHMVRLADELGLLVWSEIPVYWTIDWANEATLANARQQLAELIARDRNRASVIVWSVANEAPPSEPRTHFLRVLIDDARRLDATRLVSAAMEVHYDPARPNVRIVNDPLGEFTDLVSFNQYVGWYDGLPEKCDQVTWEIEFDKPVVVSEFGADALAGFHADPLTKFSEDYQEDLYRRTLPMLQKIPQLRGISPWILADFRSPRRLLPNVQDGWNRKGVIGSDGRRKRAFFVLRDWYAAIEQAEQGRAP